MKKFICTVLFFATILTSCEDNLEKEESLPSCGSCVSFNVLDSLGRKISNSGLQVRGELISSDNFYSSFGAFGYSFKGKWKGTEVPTLMKNIEVSKSEGWNTHVQWPSSGNVRFFAYAPYVENLSGNGIDDEGFSFNDKWEGSMNYIGEPILTYQLPHDVLKQKDLLGASSSIVDCDSREKQTCSLKFYHLLSNIQIDVTNKSNQNLVLNRVSIEGVQTKADFYFSSMRWSYDYKKIEDFILYEPKVLIEPNNSYKCASGSNNCFMIPQRLSSYARIKLEFNLQASNKRFTAYVSLSNKTWRRGSKHTYEVHITQDSF